MSGLWLPGPLSRRRDPADDGSAGRRLPAGAAGCCAPLPLCHERLWAGGVLSRSGQAGGPAVGDDPAMRSVCVAAVDEPVLPQGHRPIGALRHLLRPTTLTPTTSHCCKRTLNPPGVLSQRITCRGWRGRAHHRDGGRGEAGRGGRPRPRPSSSPPLRSKNRQRPPYPLRNGGLRFVVRCVSISVHRE